MARRLAGVRMQYLIVLCIGALSALAWAVWRLRALRRALSAATAQQTVMSRFASDWHWTQDAAFRFTGFEGASLARHHLVLDALRGKCRWELPGHQVSEADMAAHRACCERHEAFFDFEYGVEVPGMGRRWLVVSGYPVFDESGVFVGYRGLARDDTQRHVAERALRDSEQRLAAILAGSPVPVFALDERGVVVAWNRGCELVMGVGAEAMIGSASPGVPFYGEDRPVLAHFVAGLKDMAELATYYGDAVSAVETVPGALAAEGFFPGLGGQDRWLSFLAAPMRDASGRVIGAIETLQDVTERKQAEMRLHERNQIFRTLIDNIPAGVALVDKDLQLITWNAEWLRLLRLPPAMFATDGRSIEGVFRYLATRGDYGPGEVEGKVARRMARAGRFERHFEEWARRDGTVLELRSSPLAAGGFVAVFTDVTGRRRDQHLLEAKHRELEEAQRIAHIGSWRWALGAAEVDVSEEMARFLGAPDRGERITLRGGLRCLRGDDRARLHRPLMALVREGEPLDVMCQVQAAGRVRDVHLLGRAERDEAGRLVRVVGTAQDVTARREAERALSESEQKFHAIFNQTFQFIGLLSPDGILLEANQTSLDFAGVPARDVIGRPFADGPWWQGAPESRQRLLSAINRAAAGQFERFETEHPAADGSTHFVDFSLKPVFDAMGRVSLLIPEGRDITSFKLAQAELHAGRQMFATIFDKSPVALALVSLTRQTILQVNAAWERVLAIPAVRAIDNDTVSLGLWDDPSERLRFLDLVGQTHRVDGFEARLHRGDGTQGVFEISSRVVLLDEQRVLLSSLVDVTEQRRAREEVRTLNATLEARVRQRTEELLQAKERLEQAMGQLVQSEKLASLGAVVAGVAHELNTPLGNALTVASALHAEVRQCQRDAAEGGLTRTRFDEFMRTSQTAAELLERNIDRAARQINTFKQVAVDQTSERRREFDLRDIVDEALLTFAPRLARSPHRLTVDIPEGIRMDSYPGPLEQVLANLVTNALIHAFDDTTGGQMRLCATRERADEIVLRFEDNGRGMSAEVAAHVFDPFYTTRLGQGGSGLGLYIAYNFVTGMLGGQVSLRTAPGEGAGFVVRLPCVAPERDAGAVLPANLLDAGAD
ncbi:PAS domain S-box protein [Denitromonas ohlonensis]|uniref:histidine kinase n=3 Tax=Denitromonas TaxID=139331 RepID=A0A557RTQ3_9RHOO|nr:PAS domain S-box protein [Denitromonas ohlonensis]TVO74792.1 PAS domain S-box protein [Denitromonas ohlonensis]